MPTLAQGAEVGWWGCASKLRVGKPACSSKAGTGLWADFGECGVSDPRVVETRDWFEDKLERTDGR